MLTDIFAYRYLEYPIWKSYTEVEQRLLNQAFSIVGELFPYYDSKGMELETQKAKWESLHAQLARELGVDELSKRFLSYTQKNMHGQDVPVVHTSAWNQVCGNFVKSSPPTSYSDPDRFIKERLSFIELAFRLRGSEISFLNANLPKALQSAELRDKLPSQGMSVPGRAVDGVRAFNAAENKTFIAQVAELNERFRRARVPLSYHNGFIQVSTDVVIERNIAKPFWEAVADPLWENVDIDMKEALDSRDSNGKDPALFAAKALESAIKIVSDSKGWTRGNETGASNYIDNLVSKKNGGYLDAWEGELLREFFKRVRNPLNHGPGSAPMPVLTMAQTDWAIESAMSWVRTLVRRM